MTDLKDRPRCRIKRMKTVRVVKIVSGKPVASMVRKNAPCGMLLDRNGKCWFCGRVDRTVRQQIKDSTKEITMPLGCDDVGYEADGPDDLFEMRWGVGPDPDPDCDGFWGEGEVECNPNQLTLGV